MSDRPDTNCAEPCSNLTQSQLLIYTGQQLNPEAPLYNMALAFHLHGVVDETRFCAAFSQLVAQSDALRTVFYEADNLPMQRVLPTISAGTVVVEWLESEVSEQSVSARLSERAARVFPLDQPLFDSLLIKRSNSSYIWYFNQHHLITDGWSVTVLYKQLATLYAASDAELADVQALPPYSDYRKAEAVSREKDNSFWEEQLKSLPPAPSLYGEAATGPQSNNVRHTVRLGTARVEALKALTAEPDIRAWTQHMALFNIFASVLLAFVHRVSGQQQLAIGTPAHNRATPAFKQTPGLFIELFPLAANIAEQTTFSELFAQVQQEGFELLKNARPGAATAALSRSFNVVLNYINASFSDFAGLTMHSDWVHPNHVDPAHVLRLQVHDFDGSGDITLHFDANTSVFPLSLREAMQTHFLALLDAFIADRTQPVGKPALEAAPPRIVPPKSEKELTIGQTDDSNTVALQCGHTALTYAQFNTQRKQLARVLQQQGVSKGDRVAVQLNRSIEYVLAVTAILELGACFVPLDPALGAARVNAMLADANPALVITNEQLNDTLQTSSKLLLAETFMQQLAALNDVVASDAAERPTTLPSELAYILYTSGSTGKPKGVMISRGALAEYLAQAKAHYAASEPIVAAFCTAIGFDLTITSLLLPLVSGGTCVVYPEPESGPDLAVLDVLRDNKVNFVKLTPSHLALVQPEQWHGTKLRTMLVGGEDFKASLAQTVQENTGAELRIFNEYGPTECTVGCIVQQFGAQHSEMASVPIGQPFASVFTEVRDAFGNRVPQGVAGELFLGGSQLAQGYWQQDAQTTAAFLTENGHRLYRTGDLVRENQQGIVAFLGRLDEQVKISGRRVEVAEIEHALQHHEGVQTAVVDLRSPAKTVRDEDAENCIHCGLPANYPNADFDERGVCGLCRGFEDYQAKVQRYFKTLDDFKVRFEQLPANREYDCIALLSGGKDSTYVLARLVEMGIKPLAFTLDNGYISEQAKDNIRRIVTDLGVDHVFGTTPAMNDIFVDSLQRHCNVCDGCFKTIYTLSIKLALEKNIPYIISGLSRGQFFETRLTEELFRSDDFDPAEVDRVILNARKAYHRVDDAVKRLLDVSAFENDEVFERVQFLDFYRYTDVSLDEMLRFLDEKVSWIRPTDTGRSTNCLINQAGIFVHKKELGYSNYSFPYSWDVRLGHKEREAALEEINEEIDEQEVARILDEIGYTEAEQQREKHLVAWYVSDAELDEVELREHMRQQVPDYMVPVQFIRIDKLPITANGKVDRNALPLPETIRPVTDVGYVAPRTDIEEILCDIWSEVLNIEKVGIYDRFLDLGGSSLAAIRIITRANEAFQLELPLNLAFNKPTIAAFADYVRETIIELLAQMDAEDS